MKNVKRVTAWAFAVAFAGVSGPALAESPAIGFETPRVAQAEAEQEAAEGEAEQLSVESDPEVRALYQDDTRNPRTSPARWGPYEGDFEFTLSGSGSNDGDFENGGFGLDATLGYYLTRDISIELRQGVNYSDVGGDSAWAGSTRGVVDYHFDMDRLRPFVGVSIGAFYGDNIDETGSFGLEGGLKYYVKQDTFLFGRAEHHWLFDSGDSGSRQILYTVGVGFNF